MKKFLEKLIETKEARAAEIKEAIKTAEDADQVRSLGGELETVQAEIRDAKAQLVSLDNTPEQRDFNPLAAFGLETKAGEKAEKRAKAFAESGKMTIEGTEARSILLNTGSLAKPTKVSGINNAQNTVSSIIDQVRVEDATGMGEDKEAYVKSIQSAGMATDGTASTPSDPVFRTAAIKPFLIDTLTYVSREIAKQTPLRYAEKVQELAMQALRTKAAKLIVSGNGSTEPYGIINAVNTEQTPEAIYESLTVDTNVIDAATLRKIVFAYGGNENIGANAVLYLNKADLIAFGDVRGDSEKKAIYEIIPDGTNPNTGIIKEGGLAVPYCINSECTALSGATKGSTPIKTMIYGDPMNYKLDLFGDYEVRVSEDYKFGERMLAILGEVMLGGNITYDKGFVVVTLAAN